MMDQPGAIGEVMDRKGLVQDTQQVMELDRGSVSSRELNIS